MAVLVRRFGGDPNAKDQARVLRLPGTIHRKGEPFEVTWDYGGTVEREAEGRLVRGPRRYTPGELLKAFAPDAQTEPERPAERRAPDPIGNPIDAEREIVRIADALRFVEPEPRDTWFTVLCALKPFGEDGYAVLDEWARRTAANNYDARDQRYQWDRISDDRPGGITVRSVYRLAIAGGWKPARADAAGDVMADLGIAGAESLGTPDTGEKPSRKLLEYSHEVTPESLLDRDKGALVHRLLYPGDAGMLYAESGVGKTFLGAHLGWHISLGLAWNGRKVKQAPVIYVSLEGVDGFRKRVQALKTLGEPGVMFARLAVHVSLATGKDGDAGLAAILAAAEEVKATTGMAVGLVVIDTMARAIAGDDENTAKEAMHYLQKRVGEISRRTGAATLTIQHENKAGAIRGSSAYKAGYDLVLHAANGMLFVEKAKDDESGPLCEFDLVPITVAEDEATGEAVWSCILKTSPTTAKQHTTPTRRRKPVPKGVLALREAFSRVEQGGRASVEAVRAEFVGIYATGETGETASEKRGRAFRRAVTDWLPPDITIEIVGGEEFLVARTTLSTPGGQAEVETRLSGYRTRRTRRTRRTSLLGDVRRVRHVRPDRH